MFFFGKKKKQAIDVSNSPQVKSFDLPYQPELLQFIFPKTGKEIALQHLTNLVQLYGSIGFVFACVQYIAKCLRLIDFEVIDPRNNQVVTDCSLYKLLKSPNPEIGFSSFLEAYAVSVLLTGNFYNEIVRVRNNQVKALYPLQPHRVRIENDKYIYMVQNKEIEISKQDIIHIKTYNPMDDLYGFPPLISTEDDVKVLGHINKFLNKYFENGALVSGVIESEKRIPGDVFERLKKVWYELYTGVRNAFKVPILEGGLKFKPMSAHVSDTQALDIDTRVIEKILAVFNVPPELLGLRTQKARVLSEVRRAFWEDTVMPFAGRLEEALNTPTIKRKIAPLHEQHLIVKFNYDNVPALREDRLTLARVTAIVADRGIMTRNEIRERFFKLPKVEGGDEFLLPLNMMQVESGRKPENEGLGRPPSSESMSAKSIKSYVNIKEDEWLLYHSLIELNMADQISNVYSKQRDRIKTRVTSMLTILLLLSPEERERKLRKELQDIYKLTEIDLEGMFSKVADRIYYDILREIEPASAIIGEVPKELTDFVSDWAKAVNAVVNETTTEEIIKILDNALVEGIQLDIAVNKIFNKLTNVIDGVRLARIARTETTCFLNGIRLLVYKKYGFTHKVWRCVNDERTRPAHREVDGQKVKIDDYFEVGGYKTEAPGSFLLPPDLRVNCRCWLIFTKE